MPKVREVFVCGKCGSVHSRWMGRCADCGAWDALKPERFDPATEKDPQRALAAGWAASSEAGSGLGLAGLLTPAASAEPLERLRRAEAPRRMATGIGELDRVLGGAGPGSAGGLVPGSVTLIGGAPGIGKSTLMLQAALAMARHGTRVLYVSSEESSQQVALRAGRLGERGEGGTEGGGEEQRASGVLVLSDANLARIAEQARKATPGVIVIDSIQMVYHPDCPASPGSVTQLRRCAADLVGLAKVSGIAVVMVGHVTKEGRLAGPRVLEHLVDTVLSFEGDRYHAHRLVRGVKNRFGSAEEIGIFEMTGTGLREAPEGAGVAAVAGGSARARPGSVVCPVVSGSRCVLVEIQALTATGFLGAAKRKSSGLDASRLAMLIAVLEQHAELRLADRDIFASSVGGVRVAEPAADLALLLAIAGAHLRRALGPATAVVGEVGLGGEVRPVTQAEVRVREAARLGFRRVVVPKGQGEVGGLGRLGVEVQAVETMGGALELLG